MLSLFDSKLSAKANAVPRGREAPHWPKLAGPEFPPRQDSLESAACKSFFGPVLHRLAGILDRYLRYPSAIRARVTVTAPPIRVEICANGISSMRFAAVRIATSPVPPWPL
jgi:hypothetical protein